MDSGADAGPQAVTISLAREADREAAERWLLQTDVALSENGSLHVSDEILDCDDCYRFDNGERLTLTAGRPLGLAYGMTHYLESQGWRFFHPEHSAKGPATTPLPLGVEIAPEMHQRGLHLHTLHPIEGLYAMWVPGAANRALASDIFTWLVRIRGNFVTYPGLDDISGDEAVRRAWQAHTSSIIAEAHEIGVHVGVGVQLFGLSNLQKAFDLVDDIPDDGDLAPLIDERLEHLRTDPPLDEISLSFGEFFGAEPAAFIDAVNVMAERTFAVFPDIAINATVHVGDSEDQRVEWMGRNMIYYFLVAFADPRIVPSIHTVMFYTLFDDAGGAYHHEDFAEHRAYLFERLAADEPVAYHPESAYWIAFDNSVPVWLPLYVHSRHRDVQLIREQQSQLGAHILFSSGWEWGYWQFDYATLRLNHTLPDDWKAHYQEMFAPWGEAGAELASVCNDTAALQRTWLLERRLTPYFAGRDVFIDVGDASGILAQPDRVQVTEVPGLDATGRMQLEAVLDDLETYATELAALRDRADAIEWTDDPRWIDEIRDGLASNTARAEFVLAVYRAALAADPEPFVAAADAAFERGQAVVQTRHATLHSSDPERLKVRGRNPTRYQYGYLFHADSLCFWQRERAKLSQVLGQQASVPACGL